MKRLFFIFLILGVSHSLSAQHSAAKAGEMVVIEKMYTGEVINGYNLYLPKSYDKGVNNYPIILFLCGGSSVGGEIDVVKRWPIPKLLVEETDMSLERNQYALDSFIVVSPHMIAGAFEDRQWYQNTDAMKEILAEVFEKYKADPYRVYVTGLSRGGHGTWGLISKMGDYFAAAVPIAGAIHGVDSYEQMLNLPIWTVHNEFDETVDIEGTLEVVKKVEELTEDRFLLLRSPIAEGTSYLKYKRILSSVPRQGHDAWTDMYESLEFYKWLLQHSKRE